jgi:hypothetical protein
MTSIVGVEWALGGIACIVVMAVSGSPITAIIVALLGGLVLNRLETIE